MHDPCLNLSQITTIYSILMIFTCMNDSEDIILCLILIFTHLCRL